MRKLFSLMAVAALGALLAVNPVHAQGLEIGAEAGLNLSDLSVDGPDTEDVLDSATGIRFGGILRVNTGSVFGFQTGLSYSQKGAEFSQDIVPEGSEADVAIDYLEVPVLLNLNIPTGPAPVQPRVYAGGNISFELACDVNTAQEGVSGSVECASDAADDFLGAETKSTDFGLLFGGGLGFPAGPGAFNVDVRYDLGLTDIFDDDADEVELKNRNFQAVAGYSVSIP